MRNRLADCWRHQLAWTLGLLTLNGVSCQAPVPAMNWAPNAEARISPPATGSYGSPDPYYQLEGRRSSPASPARPAQRDTSSRDRRGRDDEAFAARERSISRAEFEEEIGAGRRDVRDQYDRDDRRYDRDDPRDDRRDDRPDERELRDWFERRDGRPQSSVDDDRGMARLGGMPKSGRLLREPNRFQAGDGLTEITQLQPSRFGAGGPRARASLSSGREDDGYREADRRSRESGTWRRR